MEWLVSVLSTVCAIVCLHGIIIGDDFANHTGLSGVHNDTGL